MLIIRGVNVYPSQIEEAIISVAQGEAPYQIIVERKGALDSIEVIIEVTNKIFSLELQKQRSFLETVKKRIGSVTGIGVSVKLVEANSLPASSGRISPVVDKRQI
jgi:phenylacetate-CoA ligase